jgi:hypothetical protein
MIIFLSTSPRWVQPHFGDDENHPTPGIKLMTRVLSRTQGQSATPVLGTRLHGRKEKTNPTKKIFHSAGANIAARPARRTLLAGMNIAARPARRTSPKNGKRANKVGRQNGYPAGEANCRPEARRKIYGLSVKDQLNITFRRKKTYPQK